MRIFLTGATGFIGGSVANRLLQAGHQVRGLTRSRTSAEALAALGVEPVLGSLDDADLLTREARDADAVINTADSDHAGSAATLVAALAGSGKPLLHTSGSSIVSDDAEGAASDQVFTEADIATGWQPIPAKAARVAIDRTVLDAAHQGVRSVVICPSLIYGYGRGLGRDSIQIPLIVEEARSSGVVHYIGPGRNIWSTVHIDDTVDLYLRALANAPAGAFYFVENGEASLSDMAHAIADALGLGTPQSWDIDSAAAWWGAGPARHALASNSRVRAVRAREELGWRPQHDSVLAWIRAELKA